MAASKSASRKSAAKTASKTRKSRAAARKASKTRKRQAAGKKATTTRKRRAAAKKTLPTRKARTPRRRPRASEVPPAIAELDQRMAIVRNNLRELVEQAASLSGASDEELMSQRIAEQEARLETLRKQREELSRRGS